MIFLRFWISETLVWIVLTLIATISTHSLEGEKLEEKLLFVKIKQKVNKAVLEF
jgi:hypothetical protein